MFVPPPAESNPERDAYLSARDQAAKLMSEGMPPDAIAERLTTAHAVDPATAELIVASLRPQWEREQREKEDDANPLMRAGRAGAIVGAVLGAGICGAAIPAGDTYPYPFTMMKAAAAGAMFGGAVGVMLARLATQNE